MAEPCNLSTAEMALQTRDAIEVLPKLQGTIHFVVKELGISELPAKTTNKTRSPVGYRLRMLLSCNCYEKAIRA